MCGRFSLKVEMDELLSYYGLAESSFDYAPRYNMAPGQMMGAVIKTSGERKLGALRWGLVPSWAKDEKVGYMMINARSETILEKPAFRKLIATKRCAIPADGFYEWRKADKQPFRFTMKDQSLFSFAGLFDTWVAPSGEKLSTFTIITTEANELMKGIHDRLPAIIPPEQLDPWLNREITNTDQLLPLLTPWPSDWMTAYPVSPIVGNVRNDVPECIEPYELPPKSNNSNSVEQLELF